MKDLKDSIKILKQIKARNKNEKVYIAQNVENNQKLLIKTFSKSDESSYISFLREKAVDFENNTINKLVFFDENASEYFIAREFLNGVDLDKVRFGLFTSRKENINFYLKSIIKVADGVEFLHSKKIIHRDLRPANIFVKFEENSKVDFKNPNVKLIDFGMVKAKSLEKIDNLSPYALIFSPPEQVLRFNDLVNETSDIYSLGVTLWTLLTGKLPFNQQIPELVATLQLTYNLPKNNRIPSDVYKVIQKATYKAVLKTSFKKYKRTDLKELLEEAQTKRYQSVEEFRRELEKCLPNFG